jgi:NAD(P)-dependent dehydrogenase (short-subunit alcohol dehydrogenase family)
MPRSLSNRIALVTGASRGIGFATALLLGRAGAHVVAAARTANGLDELKEEMRKTGGNVTVAPIDIRDAASIARLAAALGERHRRLDILIGNAGIGGPNLPLSQVDPAAWDEVMTTNLTANWQLIRHFGPLLCASDAGRVVFVSSFGAHALRPSRGPYDISKAALEALARVFAAETASSNIRVNLFNPGPTRTKMRAAAAPTEDPMTLPTPEEVAEKIVDLVLPSFAETGKLYDFSVRRLITFRKPTEA